MDEMTKSQLLPKDRCIVMVMPLTCGVATLQGQAGPRYSLRWINIHGAVGMSGMSLFTGG